MAHLHKHKLPMEGVKLEARMASVMRAEGIEPPPERIAKDRNTMLAWLADILSKRRRIKREWNGTEKTVEEGLAFYRTADWKRARIDALIRLGRRCACCGATPETGAVLNVDHIKPLRFNWNLRLEPDNLQILCADCNQGKGNRIETDFRTHAPVDVDLDDPIFMSREEYEQTRLQ